MWGEGCINQPYVVCISPYTCLLNCQIVNFQLVQCYTLIISQQSWKNTSQLAFWGSLPQRCSSFLAEFSSITHFSPALEMEYMGCCSSLVPTFKLFSPLFPGNLRLPWVTVCYSNSPHWLFLHQQCLSGFPCGSAGKESVCSAGDLGLIPGLGRSAGEGKGYHLQYSGLENPMDCIVHRVAKSQTQLNNFHFTHSSSQPGLLLETTEDREWVEWLFPPQVWYITSTETEGHQ